MASKQSAAVATARPTAVICDDDAMTRKLISAVLEKAGYEVVGRVDNAMSAIEVATILAPDVLLLDLVLPNMSGEDAIAPIRASAPGCMIIVCSSHNPTTALKSGASLFVPKGQLAELESVLTSLKPRFQQKHAS